MPFVILRLVAILIDLTAKGPENVDVFKEYYNSNVVEFASKNNYLFDVDIAFIGYSITDGYEHFSLGEIPTSQGAWEILSDRRAHEKTYGSLVCGMAYGSFDNRIIKILRHSGIA
ncbi:MAG: hypothetical protein IKJ13_01955 [Clostridia bacterium]|nr:hypothetical protein [Clostridia bacterium]